MTNQENKLWQPNKDNNKVRVTQLEEYVLCLAYKDVDCYFADFAIYEILGTDEEGRITYDAAGDGSIGTYNLNEAPPLLHGFVKYDGCTQFWYNDLVHIDSQKQLALLHLSIETARKIALTELISPEHVLLKEYEEQENDELSDGEVDALISASNLNNRLFKGFKPTWESQN